MIGIEASGDPLIDNVPDLSSQSGDSFISLNMRFLHCFEEEVLEGL